MLSLKLNLFLLIKWPDFENTCSRGTLEAQIDKISKANLYKFEKLSINLSHHCGVLRFGFEVLGLREVRGSSLRQRFRFGFEVQV